MFKRRRKLPINLTVAEVELKLDAIARMTRNIRKVCLIFYQEGRKYDVGYSDFLDIWFKAAEDVYERDNKHNIRDRSPS